MSMKLYVGNLSFETSSNELQTLFAQTGTVESVSLIEDRETGRSRGYGFVEMSTKEEGAGAIGKFNAQELAGGLLKIVKQGARVAMASSRCQRRKKAQRRLRNSTARN